MINDSALLLVEVRGMSGERLFGPEHVSPDTRISELLPRLSARVPTSSTGATLRLACGAKALSGDEQLGQLVLTGEDTLSFSLVVTPCRYNVHVWGDEACGGSLGSVATQLDEGVVSVHGNGFAFAAMLPTGKLVSWGNAQYGGDSQAVAGSSPGIVKVHGIGRVMSALREDGSVVTWGDPSAGGDSSSVSTHLSSGVVSVASTCSACAAVKADGSVVTWGASQHGGDSSSVADQLRSGVVSVVGNDFAFVAIKEGGAVVAWGHPRYGGDTSHMERGELSSGVVGVACTGVAFAALKDTGAVVVWGNPARGGDATSVADQLTSGVTSICGNGFAFAAVKTTGQVVTWGKAAFGGDSSSVASKLSSGVASVKGTGGAFAALKDVRASAPGSFDRVPSSSFVSCVSSSCGVDLALLRGGAVVTWGKLNGDDYEGVVDQLGDRVVSICSSGLAFAALTVEGTAVTWGLTTDVVEAQVKYICGNCGAFCALRERS